MTHSPPHHHVVDNTRRQALQAVADGRAVGGFFYAHLVGIRGQVLAPGTARLSVDPSCIPGPGRPAPSVMALATMADLALGTALRSRLSPGQLLATVSLTLVLTRPANGTVTAEANVLHVDPGGGTAVCDLVDGAGRFGHAVGSFAAQRNPGATGLTITPWEHPSPPRGLPLNGGMALAGDLTTAEHAAVEAAVSAGERAHQGGTQYCDELLDVSVSLLDEDRCLGTSPVTPALANRAGTVQGGALLALVLAVARPLVPSGTWQLRELSYNFLRPASEPALEVRARARRRARRSVVVTADVLCSAMDTGLAVLRFAPVEAGS